MVLVFQKCCFALPQLSFGSLIYIELSFALPGSGCISLVGGVFVRWGVLVFIFKLIKGRFFAVWEIL